MEIAELKRIAKKDGMTTAIKIAVSEDPDHRFLRHNVSLASLVRAYSGDNETKKYADFLWKRILKGKDEFPALLRATASLQSRNFPWEFVLYRLLDRTQTISQFRRVVKICTPEDSASINRRRQTLAKDLLARADEIKSLLALRKFINGHGEQDKLGHSLADAKANKDLADKINYKIYLRSMASDKLLREIADNNLFNLGSVLRDEAVKDLA